jgi:hypothetical protein
VVRKADKYDGLTWLILIVLVIGLFWLVDKMNQHTMETCLRAGGQVLYERTYGCLYPQQVRP